MKKEQLTQENIKKDLLCLLKFRARVALEWRLSYIIPVTLVAAFAGFLLQNVWGGLAIGLVSLYHAIRLAITLLKLGKRKRAVKQAARADLTASLEALNRTAAEIVYEPWYGHRGPHCLKEITVFHFHTGESWRLPKVRKHYSWSKTYDMSTEGLGITSVSGNDFYFVRLQNFPEVGYIYNTKFFTFEEE